MFSWFLLYGFDQGEVHRQWRKLQVTINEENVYQLVSVHIILIVFGKARNGELHRAVPALKFIDL